MGWLQTACTSAFPEVLEARLLWAACCCLGYFGFLCSGEFTATTTSQFAVQVSDVATDSHLSPWKRRGQHLPGKDGTAVCPVLALLHFMAIRPNVRGPLLVHADGSPLTRHQFVRMVKRALRSAKIDATAYSGHNFRIGAASAAATAGVPVYFIKMLGRWESEAYHLYILTPRESLASISQLITQ